MPILLMEGAAHEDIFTLDGCIYRTSFFRLIAECRDSVVAWAWSIGRIPRPPHHQLVSTTLAETIIPALMQDPVTTLLRQSQYADMPIPIAEHQGGSRSLDEARTHLHG